MLQKFLNAESEDSDLQAELKNLDQLLREAAKESLTPEELRAQRISFAMGMLPHDSPITREEMERIHDSLYG